MLYFRKNSIYLLATIVRLYSSVPGAPSKLQFVDISDRSVLVRWVAPDNQNGILTGYTVAYERNGGEATTSGSGTTVNLTADVTSYRISNLTVS